MHKAVCALLVGLLAAPVGHALAQQPTPTPTTPTDTTRAPTDTARTPTDTTARDTLRAVPPSEQRDTAVSTVPLAATEDDVPRSVAGRFSVTPVVGTIFWDDASALSNKKPNESGVYTDRQFTPTVGLSAEYRVIPQVGVGFYFEAARPETRGDYFPALFLNNGGNLPADLRVVGQRVTALIYGIQGSFVFDVGRLQPYVGGGFGAVTISPDPQQNNSNQSFTNTQFQFGGGLGFRVGVNTVVRLDVRNFVFTDWDRDELNPTSPAFQNTTVPSVNANPPAEKSTINNFRIALGFTYIPRGGGGPRAGDEPEDQE